MDSVAFLRRWFEEVWNRGNQSAIDEMMASDCKAYGLVDAQGNEAHGSEAFKAFHQGFMDRFSNVRIDVEDVIVQGDRTATRCLVTLIERTTSKTASFSGIAIARLENGKIVEAWNQFDFGKLERDLASPGGSASGPASGAD